MSTEQPQPEAPPRRSPFLVRGESLIAFIGVSATVILLIATFASTWWMLLAQKESQITSRREEINSLGKVLAPSIESLLAARELSAVRRLMLEVRRNNNLLECRISLPSGDVIADADPSKASRKTLPDSWPAGPLDGLGTPPTSDRISLKYPLLIPGRGPVLLEIAAAPTTATHAQWEAITGAGLIGAAGLAGMLFVYRRTRSHLHTLGLIREALLALRGGETAKEALGIGTQSSPEAVAWNELISEMTKLRQRTVADEARGSQDSRRGAGTDLGKACDALSQGLINLDEQGHIKYANGAAAVFLQAKREAMLGADMIALVEDEDLKNAIRAAISGTTRQRKTLELERRDERGSGVFRFSIRPLRSDDGGSVLISIEDITQQRVAEASRNSFVAQATHELRTPLANIRLYLETALDEGEKDAVVRSKCLNVISDESRRLERMVGEMLSVAEIEAGSVKIRRDDVRLDKLFEELQADYAASANDKKITLVFELPPKLPVINADRDKLILALHNLIGNALKYTPESGKVTVTVKFDGKQLLVDVTDSGIGVADQELQLIFEKFYRSKDPRVGKITGSGLGLALAKNVVVLHGGDITVQSELNKGSTFTLTLPTLKNAA